MSEDQSNMVQFYLQGSLAKVVSGGPPFVVPVGLTVMEAVNFLKIPQKFGMSALVNGQSTDFTYRLQLGDEVHLLPQISGG